MNKIKPQYYVRLAPFIIIAANVFFTGSFSIAKLMTKEVGIIVILLFRFLAGPIYLLPYSAFKKCSLKMNDWGLLFFRVFCGVGAMASLFLSFKYGDIGKGTLIFELSILWTVFVDAIYLKQRLHRLTKIAIPVAFIGLFLVINPTNLSTLSLGDGFALLGSLFNTGVYISLKKLRTTYGTVAVVFWSYALAALILVIPALNQLSLISISHVKLLIIMSSIGIIGQLLMTLGFKFSQAGISSLFMMSLIPFTTLSGIFIFDEVYTSLTLIGMSLIFGSLMVIAKYR